MSQAIMKGTRLEFVVVPLEGTVVRPQYKLTPRGKGKDGKPATHDRSVQPVEQPAGYMVYFPRGHVLRLTKKQLKTYGLNRDARIINLQGLADPNSPLGKLYAAQDDTRRAEAYASLEKKVIDLATHKTGVNLLTRDSMKEAA